MKRWERYGDYLLSGDWHVHTNYTDGKNNVSEYCKKAEENNLKLIAFTEHVRKKIDYSFESLVDDVKKARSEFNIKILVGCEAKVLDLDGNIDVFSDIIEKCDIVLGAFHSFPFDSKKEYLMALNNMLKNPNVDIWAHPTLFARKNNFLLTTNEKESIIKNCIKNRVLIEKNKRYNLPDEDFIKIAKELNAKFVMGSDSHSVDELYCLKK